MGDNWEKQSRTLSSPAASRAAGAQNEVTDLLGVLSLPGARGRSSDQQSPGGTANPQAAAAGALSALRERRSLQSLHRTGGPRGADGAPPETGGFQASRAAGTAAEVVSVRGRFRGLKLLGDRRAQAPAECPRCKYAAS